MPKYKFFSWPPFFSIFVLPHVARALSIPYRNTQNGEKLSNYQANIVDYLSKNSFLGKFPNLKS